MAAQSVGAVQPFLNQWDWQVFREIEAGQSGEEVGDKAVKY
jgi:hypothetical protein